MIYRLETKGLLLEVYQDPNNADHVRFDVAHDSAPTIEGMVLDVEQVFDMTTKLWDFLEKHESQSKQL